jgi:hypothetical protein
MQAQVCIQMSLEIREIVTIPHRFAALDTIFILLDAWFVTPQQSWEWFTEVPIAGFGNITPAQVVLQYGESGPSMVLDYIRSKNLGGFE